MDLPAELRNDLYARFLIVDSYVRLTAHKPTRVPGLAILRVCKQMHDEAASIFYAANSFYCYVEKEIHIARDMTFAYPKTCNHQFRLWALSPDPEVEASDIFFPSPRYHVFLTRITIDAKVAFTFSAQNFPPTWDTKDDEKWTVEVKVQEGLNKQFYRTYERMMALWEEKERRWEGRMLAAHDGSSQVSRYTVSFCEEAEEECRTKGVLRG